MQKMSIMCIVFLSGIFSSVGVEISRTDEGFPNGYLPFCPRTTRPAEIARSQLKYLQFVVQGQKGRRRYSYWNAHRMAHDPKVDFKRKTMLLALGYLDSSNFPIAKTFAGLYEDLNYNVILTDYQRFTTVHYFLASRLMRPIGKHIAEVLANLTTLGLDPSNLELLGFSLGGHTVSFIAKSFRDLTGRNISRITALEPSGPCFRSLGPKDRLDRSDADFVDVIHTNIDGYGMATPLGHVNFYINGGEYQTSDVEWYPCTSTCSHFKCLTIWFSALRNPGKFIAMKCKTIQDARDQTCYDGVRDTNVLGLETDRTKPGIYYLAIKNSYPYFLGEDGLKDDWTPWRDISIFGDSNETVIYV